MRATMKCEDFLARFSEFYDGRAVDVDTFEGHLSSCAHCRRYVAVIRRGVTVLRSLPGPPLREDFRPRLQHRIYHVDEKNLLLRRTSGSAARVGTVLVAAAILALAAWVPEMAQEAPKVILPAIVVSRPPAARVPVADVSRGYQTTRFLEATPDGDELWNRALYEYSPLSERYPPARLFRTGLD